MQPRRHSHSPANSSQDLLTQPPRPTSRGRDQVGGGAPRPAGRQLAHPAAPSPRHPRARRPCLTPPPLSRQLAHPAAPPGPPPTPSPARNTQGRSIGNWRCPPALACAPRLPLLLLLPDRRRPHLPAAGQLASSQPPSRLTRRRAHRRARAGPGPESRRVPAPCVGVGAAARAPLGPQSRPRGALP